MRQVDALALKRDTDAKLARQEQQEADDLQRAMREEAKAEEASEMTKSVPKELLREWRFQVALRMFDHPGVMGNERQLRYDETLVALARYAVTGKV